MRELTAHLQGQGRRRLLFWSRWWSESRDSEINWAMTERIAGFRDAVLAAGGILREGEDPQALARASRTASARPEGWIYFVGQSELDEADNCRDGRDVAVALLQAGCRPDAILCSNDERALGALTALTEAGVRIPEDMAVTGYDGIPYAAYGAIPLTTVEQPLEAMARHAADLLVRMLGGDRPAAAELRVQIPGRLAVRASSTGKTVAPQAEASAGGMRVAV
jgi:DNA-binding LacI/PurR family transcriptional regulator